MLTEPILSYTVIIPRFIKRDKTCMFTINAIHIGALLHS